MNQITTDQIVAFAAELVRSELAAGTIENYLRHVRAFAAFADGRVVTRELTQGEYNALIAAAAGKPRLALLMEIICGTGIRVSAMNPFL